MPIKGTCSHNGTWERIAGYKFIGLLERSTETPVALLLQTVQAAKIYCACFHALACKSITCQEWNSCIATTAWGYSTGSIGPTSEENVCVYIASRVSQLQTSGPGTQHQSLQNTVVRLQKTCNHSYLFNGVEPESFEEGLESTS